MKPKINEEQQFRHYIFDPARFKRERTYLIVWAVCFVCFVLWQRWCYSGNWPALNVLTGGVPLFNLHVWCIIILHYVVVTVVLGYKTLDIAGERKLGLLEE